MHGDEWRWWLVGSLGRPGLHDEAASPNRHGVHDGERQAALAGRGKAVHADLSRPSRRAQVRVALGPHLHLPDGGVPVINHGLDHSLQRNQQNKQTDLEGTNPPSRSKVSFDASEIKGAWFSHR